MKVPFFTVHLHGQAFALNVMEMEQKVISLTVISCTNSAAMVTADKNSCVPVHFLKGKQ